MYEEETFDNFIKKKSVKILIILMIVCVGINIIKNARKGICLDDLFLVQKSSDYYKGFRINVKIYKEKDSTKFKFNYRGQIRKATLKWEGKKAIIKFDDGNKLEKYWNEGLFVDEEDDMIGFEYNTVGISENYFPIDDYELGVFMCNAYEENIIRYGENDDSYGILGLLYGIFAFFLGLLKIYFPTKTHFFGSKWRYEDAELSEEGLFFEKALGVLLIIISFIAVIFC